MSSSTLFFDPDLRVRREDHSDGLLSWLAAIDPANIGLQQGVPVGLGATSVRAHIASVSVL
jgi:hypothetical protein